MNLKLFGKNTIIYGIGNISLRASAFLLVPLYTHGLSVNDYGTLAILLLTIQLMVIFMNMGMRNTFLRFAKEYEDSNLIGELLGTSVMISAAGGIIVAAILLTFFKPFFGVLLHNDNVGGYLLLTSIAAIIQTLSMHVMSYYRAKNEAMKFTLIGISAALILIIANLVMLLIFSFGIYGVLYATIISYSAVLLFVSFDVFYKKTGIAVVTDMIPKLLRFGLPLIFSMAGHLVMNSSSIYFLSYYHGPDVVAIYSVGYKFAMIVGIALTLPFQFAFQPFIFNNIGTPNIKETMSRLFTYFYIAIALVSFGILLVSRLLLPVVAPPEYSEAFILIIFLLPVFACDGLIIFGETLVSIEKKTHITGTTVGLCGILSLFLNYALVPIMGHYGAVIASFASCITAGLILMVFGSKASAMPINWLRTIFSVFLFIYFLVVVLLLHAKTDFIFYIGAIISACLLIPFVKLTNLIDGKEKDAIRKLFQAARPSF